MFFKKNEENTQDRAEMSQGQEKESTVVDSPVPSASQQESGDIIAFESGSFSPSYNGERRGLFRK